MRLHGLSSMVLAAAMMVLVPQMAAADIMYNLVSYPADQNGYALSGHITTNGKIGPLSVSDILSWSYQATDGTHTVTGTSESTVPFSTWLYGVIEATVDQLLLPDGTNNSLMLHYGSEISSISWARGSTKTYFCKDYIARQAPWYTYNPGMGGTNPWAIAEVPEPSTLALLATGAIGLLAYAWRRRKAV